MGASNVQTSANMIKTCVGAAILALPNAFFDAGLIPSLIILLVVTLWSGYTTKRLVDCMGSSLLEGFLDAIKGSTNDPYFALIERALGKTGVVILNICYIVTLYGIATAYQITWANLLTQINWTEIGFPWGDTNVFWNLIYFAIAIPLCLLRNLDSLGFVSLFGNIVIGISSVLVIVYGGITYGFHWDNSLLWYQHPMDVAVIFGIFCYALCIIFIGPTSKRDMEKSDKFNVVLWISLAICALLYALLGGFGSFFYHNDEKGIDPIILDNMASNPYFYYITAIGICLSCIASYPIAVYPAALAVEAWIKDPIDKPDNKTFVRNWKRILVRLFCLALTTTIAILVTDFKKVIGLIGCVTVSAVQFILPPLIHWRLQPSSTWQAIIDWTLFVIGLAVMVFTTYCTIVTSH